MEVLFVFCLNLLQEMQRYQSQTVHLVTVMLDLMGVCSPQETGMVSIL